MQLLACSSYISSYILSSGLLQGAASVYQCASFKAFMDYCDIGRNSSTILCVIFKYNIDLKNEVNIQHLLSQ